MSTSFQTLPFYPSLPPSLSEQDCNKTQSWWFIKQQQQQLALWVYVWFCKEFEPNG